MTGFTFASTTTQKQELSGTVTDGKRIVNITQSGSGYSPNQITVQKDVPVKLLVNGTNQYVCTSIMVIPKFKVWTRLAEGINEIEFTPTESGPVKFSCAMGMYTGVINVIN